MTTFIRWRIGVHRGAPIHMTAATTFARISEIQAALVVLMVFAATAVARGLFF
jgi:putative membrane protein